MAQHNEHIVRSYMEKVLALRREREQEELREEELEEIALQAGLSREDLEYARKSFQDHINRGRGFAQYGNWERASLELEHAVALSPNDPQALTALAAALWNRGVENDRSEDKYRAMQYAERALQLDSSGTEAVRLITHMTESPNQFFGQVTPSRPTTGSGGKGNAAEGRPAGRRAPLIVAALAMFACLGAGIAVFLAASGSPETVRSVTTTSETDSEPEAPEPTGFAHQVMAFGEKGVGPGRMEDARHIGLDGKGNIYVGEYGDGRVQMFGPAGEFITQWNIGEDMPMRGLAVGRDGTVYVVFSGHIHKYNGSTGESLGRVPYDQERGFDDVAVRGDGGLVAFWRGLKKEGNGRYIGSSDDIVLFDRNEKVERVIEQGISKAADGMVVSARIAVDGRGTIYALDSHSDAVFKFAPDGRFVNRIGSRGDQPGQFRAPGAIAVDGLGRLYVSDFSGVQVFDGDGRYLGVFDVEGAASGIAVDDRDGIYVVARERVFKFRQGNSK